MKNHLPLEGITVLELGNSVAAPFAGEILGDLGADVIKVEKRDGGDDARKWAPPYWHGTSAIFQNFNRNKRSVAVELRDADENARLKAFILERVDVVLQNMRPGLVEELGLDGPTLRRSKPELIYANIGAFGTSGPYKDRPGYDPLMQAFGGLMSVTGEEGRPPVRVGTAIVDMGTGLWSVIGIISALLARTRSGEGCIVGTSLYETSLAWMGHHAADYLASAKVPQRQGSGVAQVAPSRGYYTSDGFIFIAVGNDKLFALFARVLGHPEWVQDPRFRGNPERVHNREELYRMIEEVVGTFTTAELQRVLDAAGVPNAPMQSIDQALAHEQTQALGILQQSPDGKIALIGSPLSFDGVRLPFRLSPPALGAQTAEILGGEAKGETNSDTKTPQKAQA
jgi:crotonobetainyl-CoA:carnitine CoA-transferase CaiB-like acyl-CoA transferase